MSTRTIDTDTRSSDRYEPNKCERQIGSCIGESQLDDVREADVERLARGERPLHLVGGRSWGSEVTRVTTDNETTVSPSLASSPTPTQRWSSKARAVRTDQATVRLSFPLLEQRVTLMTLEVDATDLRYVRTLSGGAIVGTESEPFEALTGGGSVVVTVSNTGTLEAEYSVSLTECSEGVSEWQALAQRLTLCGHETGAVTFEADGETSQGGTFACTVHLRSSLGAVLDTRSVSLTVNATVMTAGVQGGAGGVVLGGELGDRNEPNTCDDTCGTLVDVLCFLMNRCWTRLVEFLLAVFGVVVSCKVLWWGVTTRGWLQRRDRGGSIRDETYQGERQRVRREERQRAESMHQYVRNERGRRERRASATTEDELALEMKDTGHPPREEVRVDVVRYEADNPLFGV